MDKQLKLKKVTELGKALDKKFESTGTFQQMGKKVGKIRPSISSNLPSFDWGVVQCGGAPRGRVIEIFGPESSGKTAFTCHIIGQCQKAGGVAAFIDAEHALEPTFAAKLGVDMDELVISQPMCGEEALDTVQALVESDAVDIIVVDSVSALVPRAELDGDMGESHMGLQARLMSQAMRKLVALANKHDVTVIFINQIREKIGVVFGDPETTTGGRALKFYASVRLKVRRLAKSAGGELVDADKTIIGHRMNIKAVKNKVGVPFLETQVDLYYADGFDILTDTLNHAVSIGVLTGGIKYAWPNGKGTKHTQEEMAGQLTDVQQAIVNHYKALAEKEAKDEEQKATSAT